MPYLLKRHPRVKKQLRLVPERIAKDVAQTILDLAYDPYPPIADELRDQYKGTWKIKIDGWRIFYRVNEQDKVVTVISVKRRDKDTYRRLS
ncbi:MAG: type II toxin-antitoxin system mRNA interferase toxin, RelE/StbE family [Caldilineaceae bacterium]